MSETSKSPAHHKPHSVKFSNGLGYILATAGASVGLGNIWRFPYLAAKYGGGAFVLTYFLLAITFGSTLIISETALGRASGKSPVGAFKHFSTKLPFRFGGWLNAIIPLLILSYYIAIGGWVTKYFFSYLVGEQQAMALDDYFGNFIGSAGSSEFWFLVFAACTIAIIAAGVNKGIEKVSRILMPLLVILGVIIAIYTITRPGAMEGVKYTLIPRFEDFSLMTIVAALGQMFFSLSIAMGILYAYGSYMKKEDDIEKATLQIELFDTVIAILAALMIIPGIFAFGDPSQLQAGPSLLFISMPKIFVSMGIGRLIGALFFAMVFFAAVTSAIALMEPAVATVSQELKLKRSTSIVIVSAILLVIGSASALGFNALDFVQIAGMTILDMLDFLTNTIMMPIAAFLTCALVIYKGVNIVSDEVKISSKFRQEKMYSVMVRFIAPIGLVIILFSSLASTFGLLSI